MRSKKHADLYAFFLWFRENGEKHQDKSIEKMIDVYLLETNVLPCSGHDKMTEIEEGDKLKY